MSVKFQEDILSFLEQVTKSEKGKIETSTELIDSGIIDSLSIVRLVVFLEEKTKTKIIFEEIDLDDFRTIENIVSKFQSNL